MLVLLWAYIFDVLQQSCGLLLQVYSFGVTLWQILERKRPFEGMEPYQAGLLIPVLLFIGLDRAGGPVLFALQPHIAIATSCNSTMSKQIACSPVLHQRMLCYIVHATVRCCC